MQKKRETSNEAIARGIKVEKCPSKVPRSYVYPEFYGYERISRKKNLNKNEITIAELKKRCTPEQFKLIMNHVNK